ncbi:low temperature requirement protein A [bacterium]|nr:low temperature requirement protein A [bacterium]
MVINADIASKFILFVLIYGIARLCIAGMCFTAARKYPDKAGLSSRIATLFTIGTLISISSALFQPGIALFVFYAGILFDISSTFFSRSKVQTVTIDRHHLVERVGLLANMIGHAILDNLNISEFRLMAILGMVLLYVDKQTAYIVNVPEYRYYIARNTIVVLSIAGLSLLLSTTQHILIGMNLSMIVYIIINYQAQIKLYGSVQM